MNHAGYLPEFITVTDGKTHEVTIGRTLGFSRGSIVAIDRGYNDESWYKQLTEKGISVPELEELITAANKVCRAKSGTHVIEDEDGSGLMR